MNVNRLLGILAILLLTAANALYAQKPVKVKGVQGRWQEIGRASCRERV